MEGKEAAKLVQSLLQIELSHVRELQQAVQVETQNWQEPKTDISWKISHYDTADNTLYTPLPKYIVMVDEFDAGTLDSGISG